MTRDDLTQQVEAYDSLLRHPGYALLIHEMQKLEASALTEMQNAKDSDSLVQHTRTYLTIGRLIKLPKLVRDTLASKLPQRSHPL